MPSGILCSAMARTIGKAMLMLLSETAKVARPSGKLCIAIESASMMPMRWNLCVSCMLCSVLTCSVKFISWGFSPSGMRKSMRAMIAIPAKNAMHVASMALLEYCRVKPSKAAGNISTKDTKIMTPAEKPSDRVRK